MPPEETQERNSMPAPGPTPCAYFRQGKEVRWQKGMHYCFPAQVHKPPGQQTFTDQLRAAHRTRGWETALS